MRTRILFIFLIALSVTTSAQNITAFEYFFDTDPGIGLATAANPPASPSITDFNIPISTASLSTGFHILYLRGKNTANEWTHTHLRSFYIVPLMVPSSNIEQLEYFIDTDPGIGLATQVSFTPASTISNLAIDISAVPLTAGFHIFYVRSKSSDGKWTHTHLRSFYIVPLTALTNLSQVEYFIDTDPGIGLATQVPFAAAPSITNLAIDISSVPLTPGFHKLYVRSKSSDGQWTHTQLRSFYIANVGVAQNLVEFEYFFDTDPGFDNGTAAPIAPPVPSVTNQDIFADVSSLSIGSHTVYVRAKDSGGEWTQVSTGNFSVTATLAPTISSFTPSSGGSGTTITITGTNFTGATDVNFGGTAATSFTVVSATSITAVVATGTSGNVSVTALGGTATLGGFTFITAPTITSFTPTSGLVGTTVTITGTNFSTTPANNTVKFNGTTSIVTASTATSITTTVPTGATTGTISVTVDGNTATSTSNFTVTTPTPTITSFTPTSGLVGTSVTITGTNFDTTPTNNIVKFNGTTSIVIASTATSITTTVPNGANTGKVSVSVAGNTATSTNDFTVTTPLPAITSFTPASGLVTTTVTISGANFSTTPSNNVVQFNGTSAVVTASTTTSITTTVPIGATTGKITVAVNGNTATSTTDFTVTTPGGAVTINAEPLGTSIGGTVTKNLLALISTLGNNLDINSITVTVQPTSGAVATVANGLLTVNYNNISFSGKENITIRACDTNGNCATQQFEIEVSGGIVVYNAVSPNGDGKNDFLFLQYIDVLNETKENEVIILNRWGQVVAEFTNYNNTSNAFTGLNKNGNELPSGNYFYKIKFASGQNTETGFFTLKR